MMMMMMTIPTNKTSYSSSVTEIWILKIQNRHWHWKVWKVFASVLYNSLSCRNPILKHLGASPIVIIIIHVNPVLGILMIFSSPFSEAHWVPITQSQKAPLEKFKSFYIISTIKVLCNTESVYLTPPRNIHSIPTNPLTSPTHQPTCTAPLWQNNIYMRWRFFSAIWPTIDFRAKFT